MTKTHKKTILFKIWKFPRLSETFILAQIITAIKCGYDVKILIEDLMDIKGSTHEHLIGKYGLIEKIIYEDYKIPKNKTKRYLKALFLLINNWSEVFMLLKFFRNRKKFELRDIYMFYFFSKFKYVDIVHVQYGTNARPLDLLKQIKFFPPKLIVSFHGHDLYFPINGIINNNGYYDNLFTYADLLVANTPYLKNVLLDLGAPQKKIQTIPVAVDTSYFQKLDNKSPNSIFEIITVGRLEVFKGQLLGLKCIKILKNKGYKLHYTIVGTGSQDENLMKYVKSNNLSSCVSFKGRQSQKEIRNYLQHMDVFLMTSITDPNYGVESQGLVSAEAQACGLPIIGFDSGGVKYTIADEKSGFVVPEFDVEAMTKKLEILINNESLRKEMSVNAIKYVGDNFSHTKLDKVWKSTYDSLVIN